LAALPGYRSFSSFDGDVAHPYLERQRRCVERSIRTDAVFRDNVFPEDVSAWSTPFVRHWLGHAAFPFCGDMRPFGSCGSVYRDFWKARLSARCMKVHLAVLRRLEAGEAPPRALEDLVPHGLDAVLTDPFDGKPLRFKATPEAIWLWSVGPSRSNPLVDCSVRRKRNEPSGAARPEPLFCSEYTYRIPLSRDAPRPAKEREKVR
jgi:hypothetical protein